MVWDDRLAEPAFEADWSEAWASWIPAENKDEKNPAWAVLEMPKAIAKQKKATSVLGRRRLKGLEY
jgi:hypothetical protein